MGKHLHVIVSKDIESLTGVCKECGPVVLKKKRTGYLCSISQNRWRGDQKAQQQKRNAKRKPHRKYLEDSCSRCGFEPEIPRQMDVHHIDGNHRNNDPTNLKTLCANCHRLIHHELDAT